MNPTGSADPVVVVIAPGAGPSPGEEPDLALADVAILHGGLPRLLLDRWPGLAMAAAHDPGGTEVAVRDGMSILLQPPTTTGTTVDGLPAVVAVVRCLYGWWVAGRPWPQLPRWLPVIGGAWAVVGVASSSVGGIDDDADTFGGEVESGADLAGA